MAEETKKEKPELSPELKGKFRMANGFAPGEYYFRGQKIDLTRISLAKAEELVKDKFDVLVAEAPPAAEAKSAEKKPDDKK